MVTEMGRNRKYGGFSVSSNSMFSDIVKISVALPVDFLCDPVFSSNKRETGMNFLLGFYASVVVQKIGNAKTLRCPEGLWSMVQFRFKLKTMSRIHQHREIGSVCDFELREISGTETIAGIESEGNSETNTG
jgi:hypothetical protein